MADSVSEKELEAKRNHNAKLREQIAAEEAKLSQRNQEAEANVAAAQMDAEAASLAAQLASIKAQSKQSVVNAGAAGPIEQASQQEEAAKAQDPSTTSEGKE